MCDTVFSVDDTKALYREKMRLAIVEPSRALEAMHDFVQAAYPLAEIMSAEALIFLGEREQAFIQLVANLNEQQPEGAKKRQIQRQLSAFNGKHLQAEHLVKNFPRLIESEALVQQGHAVFLRALQHFLNFMHDISANMHSGLSAFAQINLLYWAVDEVTAANFLARRGYTTLTYPHLRCVMEIIDKVELFTSKPELAERWASGDEEHKIWRDLSPPRVRELLGRDNKDPVYSLFSQMGAHSTYTAVQTRLTKKDFVSGELQIGIGVGGKKNLAEQAALMGYCILFCNACTMRASLAFPDDMNVAEVTAAAQAAALDQSAYVGSLASAFPQSVQDTILPLKILVGAWKRQS